MSHTACEHGVPYGKGTRCYDCYPITALEAAGVVVAAQGDNNKPR